MYCDLLSVMVYNLQILPSQNSFCVVRDVSVVGSQGKWVILVPPKPRRIFSSAAIIFVTTFRRLKFDEVVVECDLVILGNRAFHSFSSRRKSIQNAIPLNQYAKQTRSLISL